MKRKNELEARREFYRLMEEIDASRHQKNRIPLIPGSFFQEPPMIKAIVNEAGLTYRISNVTNQVIETFRQFANEKGIEMQQERDEPAVCSLIFTNAALTRLGLLSIKEWVGEKNMPLEEEDIKESGSTPSL